MKMLFRLSLLFISVLAFNSCGVSDEERERLKEELKAELESDNSNEDVQEEATDYSFTPNVGISKSAANVNYEGRILDEVTWKDKNGENLALFTKEGDRIWVYHYAFPNTAPTLLRKFKDLITDCHFDVNLEFIRESFDVTDLDGDNYGELTFAYTLGCRSDVSPLDMKLIMTENGDKYIIRGSQTLIFNGEEPWYGSRNIDPSLKNGPSEFLSYANRIWDRYERVVY